MDAEDPDFLAPESMKEAFDAKLAEKPKCPAGYFRCAYRSLADTYGRAVRMMEESTGIRCGKLYIVGGGGVGATGKSTIFSNMVVTCCSTVNSSKGNGGGVDSGTWYDSTIISNSTSSYGGGVYGGIFYNCNIVSNSSATGYGG